MVKLVRRMKKSLGKKRQRRRLLKKGKMRYRKKYYRKTMGVRYGKKRIKNRRYRKLYGRGKLRGLTKLKKFSRRGVAARASLKKPSALSKVYARTKTTSGSLAHNSFEYFVNSKYVFANELNRTNDQKALCPNTPHSDNLSLDNPTSGLFSSPDILLGLDDSVLNPPLVLKRTTLTLDSLSGSNYILSLYPPMNTSYKSIHQLSILLGLTRTQLDVIIAHINLTFMVHICTNGVVNNRYQFASSTLHNVYDNPARINNAGLGINAEQVQTLCKVRMLDIFRSYLNAIALVNTDKFVAPSCLVITVKDTQNGVVIDHQMIEPSTIHSFMRNGGSKANYVGALGRAAREFWMNDMRVDINSSTNAIFSDVIDDDEWNVTNRFKGSLAVLGACPLDKQNLFVSFIADIWYYAITVENKGSESIGGMYFAELTESGYANAVSFVNLDKLQKDGYLRVKLINKKETVYKPKTEPNAHLIYISRGTTFTLESQYKRNYASFINLFRNTTRNKVLRSHLTPLGERFYKKLEPSYNFGFIGDDAQFNVK